MHTPPAELLRLIVVFQPLFTKPVWEWEESEVSCWYGGLKKKLLVFSRTALWHTPGEAPVKIRYVITRHPEGKLRDEVFATTKLDAKPEATSNSQFGDDQHAYRRLDNPCG